MESTVHDSQNLSTMIDEPNNMGSTSKKSEAASLRRSLSQKNHVGNDVTLTLSEADIAQVGSETAILHVYSVAPSESLPRQRRPTSFPTLSEWFDPTQQCKRLLELRAFDTMPTLRNLREMDSYNAYMSMLFLVMQPYTMQLLRYLQKKKHNHISLDDLWEEWVSDNPTTNISSRRSGSVKEYLVRPAGSLDADVGVLTFQSSCLDSKMHGDPSSYFSSEFAEHWKVKFGNRHESLLAMDIMPRRVSNLDSSSSARLKAQEWPRTLVDHHASFAFSVIASSRASAWVLCGDDVVAEYRRHKKPLAKVPYVARNDPWVLEQSFVMPTSNLLVVLFVEFDDSGEIDRLLFSCPEPRSLHYLHRAGPVEFNRGSHFDDGVNFAAAVANIDIEWRYGEIHFLKRSLQRGTPLPSNTDLKLFPTNSAALKWVMNNSNLIGSQQAEQDSPRQSSDQQPQSTRLDLPKPREVGRRSDLRDHLKSNLDGNGSTKKLAVTKTHGEPSSDVMRAEFPAVKTMESGHLTQRDEDPIADHSNRENTEHDDIEPDPSLTTREISWRSLQRKKPKPPPVNRRGGKWAHLLHEADPNNPKELAAVDTKCAKCGALKKDPVPRYDKHSRYVAFQTNCDGCPRYTQGSKKGLKSLQIFIPVDSTFEYIRFANLSKAELQAQDKIDAETGKQRKIVRRPNRAKSKKSKGKASADMQSEPEESKTDSNGSE